MFRMIVVIMIRKIDIKNLNIKCQIHNGNKANVYELENGNVYNLNMKMNF